MRFVSKHDNYSICFQTDVTNHFGDGNSQLVRPLLNCQFGPLGLNPWEIEAAEAQFTHKGLGMFEDRVTKEDALGRYSVFDTEQFQVQNGLTDEKRQEIEAFLLGRFERGNHYILVEKPKLPAPWPSYDDTHHKSIPGLAASTGTERAAVEYERANANRPGVIADLEALLAPDPSIDPSELRRGLMLEFERKPGQRLPRPRQPLPPAAMEKLAINVDTDLAATWWGQRPGGNWYWRADVPARHLPGQVLELRYDDLQRNGDVSVVMPRQRGDTAIWCYPGNAARGILMRAQQLAGFRVLVEVDDNYLIGSPEVPGAKSEWLAKASPTDEHHSTEAHRKIAAFADGIVVTTETLAAAYREHFDHVYVCRNSVALEDWPEPEKPQDGVFRIGYSASHSHWFDANDVTRALSWAAAQSGVEVVMYGLKREWSFPVTYVPWTRDLAEYRRSLALLDVGVCPLRPGHWANCKSDIKTLEYSLAGAASIVSRTPPYVEWHDDPSVLTAETPKDFLRHVKWLVANKDAAPELAAKARERIVASRLIEHEIPKWREAVCAS